MSRSCGCLQRDAVTTHGASYTRTYKIWEQMLQRCRNPRDRRYPNYGGRGITVCDRWLTFEPFLADMGERPPGLSIDRINNDGGYEPTNCRWATTQEQMATRRHSGGGAYHRNYRAP